MMSVDDHQSACLLQGRLLTAKCEKIWITPSLSQDQEVDNGKIFRRPFQQSCVRRHEGDHGVSRVPSFLSEIAPSPDLQAYSHFPRSKSLIVGEGFVLWSLVD